MFITTNLYDFSIYIGARDLYRSGWTSKDAEEMAEFFDGDIEECRTICEVIGFYEIENE